MALTNIRQKEYLTRLPVELLDTICRNIQKVRDLKAFATINKYIYCHFGFSIIRRDPIKALIHYTAVNDINGITRALSAGANINALYKLEGSERKGLLGAAELWTKDFMPLHIAAIKGSIDAAQYLIEREASINATVGHEKATAFWLATDFESVAMMRLLYSKGSDIDRGDSYGTTPLHLSSKKGNREIVECLLDLGANIHAKEVGIADDIALGIAAGAGKIDICRLLLKKGSDINYQNIESRTPLCIAVTEGHRALAEFLLKQSAKVDLTEGFYSRTPLLIAAYLGDIGMVRLLHTNGGDIDHADIWGSTALHRAAEATDLELTKYLLKHNSDVHKKDSQGNIALGLAAQELAAAPFRFSYFSQGAVLYDPREKTYRSRKIYSLLLESGSNRLHKNNDGNTPMEIYQEQREWWKRCIRDAGS